jgi:hypothetical protein
MKFKYAPKVETMYQKAETFLKKNRHEFKWEMSYECEYTNLETWIPIINIFDNEIRIGLSILGYWVLENDIHIIRLCCDDDLRALLPCLQRPYDRIIHDIENALFEHNLPREIINNLPIRELIILALKFQSDFWASKALEWLENICIDEDIIFELNQIIKEKSMSQTTRNHAKKILKQVNISP